MLRARPPFRISPDASPRLPPLRATLLAILFAASASGCTTESRCREFDLNAIRMHGEVGVSEYAGVDTSYERQPSAPVSEEAAIYSKRHKTLCQLLWEGRINHETYERSSAKAYEEYRASRSQRERRPTPAPEPVILP